MTANLDQTKDFDMMNDEINEEQRRLLHSMRKLRYRTASLIFLTILFVGYFRYTDLRSQVLAKTQSQNTLSLEVEKLRAQTEEAKSVSQYMELIGSGSATGASLHQQCLDGLFRSTKSECQQLLSGTTLDFDLLRAVYLLQEAGQTKTYFDQARALAYIDQVLLPGDLGDGVISISFGDIVSSQNNARLEFVPVSMELEVSDSASMIALANTLETHVPTEQSLHHLFMIDDISYNIAQHDNQQTVTIDMSLYVYT